jgi:hypothetical protein
LGTFSANGRVSQVAAKLTKTNSAYIEAVKNISKHAPEFLEKVRSGVIKIPDATRLAKLPNKERKRVVAMLDGQPVSSSELHDICRTVRHIRAQEVFQRGLPTPFFLWVGSPYVLFAHQFHESSGL